MPKQVQLIAGNAEHVPIKQTFHTEQVPMAISSLLRDKAWNIQPIIPNVQANVSACHSYGPAVRQQYISRRPFVQLKFAREFASQESNRRPCVKDKFSFLDFPRPQEPPEIVQAIPSPCRQGLLAISSETRSLVP